MPRTTLPCLGQGSRAWAKHTYNASVSTLFPSLRLIQLIQHLDDQLQILTSAISSQSTMQITSALLGGLAMVVTTIASPAFPLEGRSIGSSCSTPVRRPLSTIPLASLTPRSQDGAGTCQQTTNCVSQGFNLAGYCPHDARNVQCCVKRTCSTAAGSGLCLNTADGCSAGSFHSGACPGTNAIQVSSSSFAFQRHASLPKADMVS
jgi:hypothetical protein